MANYKTRMGDSGGTVYTLYDKVFAGIQSGVYGSKTVITIILLHILLIKIIFLQIGVV